MTNEDIQAVADLVAEEWNCKPPRFFRWNKRRGHSRPGKFSLPRWIKLNHETYQLYYIIHEVCHNLNTNGWGHDAEFRRIERKALSSWGITPTYGKGAYPIKLESQAGDVIRDRDLRFS